MLETIGTSLIGIETHNTTMFKSSSKITTVGRLLDWTNKAEKLAVAKVRQRHRHPTGAKAATEANPPTAKAEAEPEAEAEEANAAGGMLEVVARLVPATIIDRDHPSAEETKAAAEVEAARLAAQAVAEAEAAKEVEADRLAV